MLKTQTTVYLIDDEPEVLELLNELVLLAGLKPMGFSRGSLFFDQITEFESNAVIILDLNMPEMDGIEVMRRLSGMSNPPGVILISGHDAGIMHSAEKLCEAHGLEYLATLAKPLSNNHVCDLLKQVINRSADEVDQVTKLNEFEITPFELEHAINNDEFVMHYQPQVSVLTKELAGVEALVRWQHPRHGLLYPDSFVDVAEENNLIGMLTHWVIKAIVEQEREWEESGLALTVSVNISAENITSLTLPEQLSQLLEDNKLDPTRLILEVTESALMGELVTSLDILTRLRLKGVRLSIDDFGTGYSSLSQLHKVPFTELKIDQGFVGKVLIDDDARAIVKTCIMLGHELNMRVVAEGVENAEIFEKLNLMGCDIAQGYYISPALSADMLESWLQDVKK